MEIVVLVKRVPDSEAQVQVKPDGSGVTVEERYGMNFFDSLAVEEALRIKEKFGGRVTAISLGPSQSVEVLRTAIAMGVDDAILLEEEALLGGDEYATARALAAAVKTLPYDLVLCGREAFDDSSGVVGPVVAQFLGIPSVTMVTKVEVEPEQRKVKVEREAEGGRELIEAPLPALLTAQKGLNEPRVPPVMGVVKAMKAQIKKLDLGSLGLGPEEVGQKGAKLEVLRYIEPPKRRAVKYIKGEPPEMVKELIELLKTEAKAL
ncbi:MAG: electron transfer flavoprotein subunit beta [Deltaproteobacteria bacterium]|nr:MAG: electron transfer flavoprotein subunit beta [Deltaproteobacteria bacterium]RLB03249.1 MAG: electron transfer flavoprotein subunit beta [Deltaproteobacteria bacterium]